MQIQKHNGYFEEYLASEIISKVTCSYEGICSVYFRDGKIHTLATVATGYNSQFGIPVSLDGKVLYVSSWETGLHAYSIETGEEIWRFKSTRIKEVYASGAYVVAVRYGEAILKFDISNGTKISELRSGTIECSYELDTPYVLIDTYRGKLSVIDMNSMSVVRQYPESLVNPAKAISFMIREVSLKRNKLTIAGLENQMAFRRVIDRCFLPME